MNKFYEELVSGETVEFSPKKVDGIQYTLETFSPGQAKHICR